jgi:hypothetical protein
MEPLRFLLGTNTTLPLTGHWERLDDHFAGCILRIEQTDDELLARIIHLPHAMAATGWKTGEVKWRRITPTTTPNRHTLLDLRKHFDPRTRSILRVDHLPHHLSLATGGILRLHTNPLPLFPDQRWRQLPD